jgi:5-formyltetrahydrofolate cyclo-ligase
VSEAGERKAAARASLRAARAAIPPEQRLALGRAVQVRLMELPAFMKARAVLLFYSFGSEIPTAGIIQRSLDGGKRVFLPLLESGTMAAAELKPGDSLAVTAYGPKEPSDRIAVDPGEVDLVVAPGLGFDHEGYRLGYGGGHYDRYLSTLPPLTPRVGIAFQQQIVDELPHGTGDERLDLIVTEREVILCAPRPGGPRIDPSPPPPNEPSP